jgi:hypothetical protein
MPIDINSNSINSVGAKLYNSTKIVTSGLVWYYDFGIADSYAGSGSSITDFTGNGNTATLTDHTYTTLAGGAAQNTTAGSGTFGTDAWARGQANAAFAQANTAQSTAFFSPAQGPLK